MTMTSSLLIWSRYGARLALTVLLMVFVVVARPALAAAELIYGQGVLWKVEREGLAPSYLFGTIHITEERILDLPAPVRAAFEGAKIAVFEVIMTDEVRMKMGREMVLTDGRNLQAILGPELFQQTAVVARRYGFEPQHLLAFKPWALALIFSLPQTELARSAAGDVPLDQMLQNEAADMGKRVLALESAEEQIALFTDIPEIEQIDMLETAVKENAKVAGVFENMVRLYLARDIEGILDAMMEQSKTMNPKYVEKFLARFNDARNVKMAERMAPVLRQGGAFVAIGALHLGGEQGLVSLLKAQGFKVERAY